MGEYGYIHKTFKISFTVCVGSYFVDNSCTSPLRTTSKDSSISYQYIFFHKCVFTVSIATEGSLFLAAQVGLKVYDVFLFLTSVRWQRHSPADMLERCPFSPIIRRLS